jgi:hypothetical protein
VQTAEVARELGTTVHRVVGRDRPLAIGRGAGPLELGGAMPVNYWCQVGHWVVGSWRGDAGERRAPGTGFSVTSGRSQVLPSQSRVADDTRQWWLGAWES